MTRKYFFSPEQQEEIINLYNSGSPATEIKKAYSITSESTIYKILHDHGIPLRSPHHRNHTAPPAVVEVEDSSSSALPLDETLPEQKTERKKFRVTLRVRLTFEADSMEGALAKAKGYNGYHEVLSITRIG